MIESSENIRSTTTSCATTTEKDRVAIPDAPPDSMMSHQEMPTPKIANSGCVSFISQVSVNCMAMRNAKANASPICRARKACSGDQRVTTIEMKTILVDAEYVFERGQGRQRRPGIPVRQKFEHGSYLLVIRTETSPIRRK